MEFFIQNQLLNIVYSVILGLIFGGIYDIIRVVQILCGIASYSDGRVEMRLGKNVRGSRAAFVIFLLTDLAFMLTVTVMYSFFAYWADNGRVRFYLMLAAAVGFYIYYNTLGRLVMLFSDLIVRLIKRTFTVLVLKPVRFILRLLRRVLLFFLNHTILLLAGYISGRIRQRKTDKYLRQLPGDIKFCETNGKQVGIK